MKKAIVTALSVLMLLACHKGGADGQAAGGAGAAKGGGKGSGAPSAAGRVIPVVLAPAAQKDVPIYLDGLGTVQAWRTVTVRSQVDGRLDKVLFNEGQEVKRGQLLAQIDPRPFLVQLHNAEGAVARDKAQLKNARTNLERFKQLREKKMVAQQQVDDQEALIGQLDGSIRIDDAAVESARLNLDYARITSPIDGVTGIRLVDQGNVVHAADATQGLVVITQLDPIAVLFTIPQDELPAISQAMSQGQLTVDALSRDGQGKLATGKLALIDNQINQATATLKLKAVFPNPQRLLWPNQFVKARLLVATRKGALVIPNTAVLRGPDGTFVFIVDADKKAVQKPVEVEMSLGDLALIGKGLQPGDQVVVDGQNQLRPGSSVMPRQATQKPGAPAARQGAIGAAR